jgi:hypothetical protein
MGKKIISFSLWGTDPKYTIGAVRNAALALEIYPSWTCRYYVGKSVPSSIIEDLKSYPNTEIIIMNQEGNWEGMFWRFYAASDPSVDIMISRDTDSRLCSREKAAVEDWLSTDKKFHIMRDIKYHGAPIMGGMWGVKDRLLFDLYDLVQTFHRGDYWQVDQDFLREKVYPFVKDSACVHDEFFENKPFPTAREGGVDEKGDPINFVGKVFDQDDNWIK